MNRTVKRYWLLLVPMVLIMGAIIGWPLLQTLVLSFTNSKLISFDPPEFVGLANFVSAFNNDDFLQSLKISGQFAIVVVTVEMLLGVSVALLLNQDFVGRNVVRALLIIPWAVPTVVNAIMWRLIYNPEYGALNSLLVQLGFISEYINWLSDVDKALWAIIFADIWKNFSLVALIVLASLQSLSPSQIEAAKIDGAGSLLRFINVTIPHIIAPLQVALVLRIIEAVKVFDIAYIMTRGGPANRTKTGSIFVYQEAFSNSRIGSGASLALIMVLLIMVFIAFYMRILNKEEK